MCIRDRVAEVAGQAGNESDEKERRRAQNDPKWPLGGFLGGPKWSQMASSWPLLGPSWGLERAQIEAKGANLAQDAPKLVPAASRSLSQDPLGTPTGPQKGPKRGAKRASKAALT